LYVPKRRDSCFSCSASASASTLCYSVPSSLAGYRRRTSSLLLPSILVELLVVSQFTGSEDIALHTLISWFSCSLIKSRSKKGLSPFQYHDVETGQEDLNRHLRRWDRWPFPRHRPPPLPAPQRTHLRVCVRIRRNRRWRLIWPQRHAGHETHQSEHPARL
jgi:hypothetical protein